MFHVTPQKLYFLSTGKIWFIFKQAKIKLSPPSKMTKHKGNSQRFLKIFGLPNHGILGDFRPDFTTKCNLTSSPWPWGCQAAFKGWIMVLFSRFFHRFFGCSSQGLQPLTEPKIPHLPRAATTAQKIQVLG